MATNSYVIKDQYATRVDLSLQLGLCVKHVAVDTRQQVCNAGYLFERVKLRVVLAHGTTSDQAYLNSATVVFDGLEWVRSGFRAQGANSQLFFTPRTKVQQ